jgi:hypothetical protein
MKKTTAVIAFATLYLVVFQLAPFIRLSDEIIIAMFILSPFVVIYMVYIVLKYGKPSQHTFDEKFYEDHNYRRVE